MYKVLIADDELWIRKAIVKRVESLGLDVEVVGEAGDGQEALDLAIHIQPDIIITDINMPCLSGLEFIREIRRQQSASKIIIISGYADFEYAQAALKLGVFQYILKTIDDNTLHDALWEVIQALETEKLTKADLQALYFKLIERTALLQKNFLQQILSGKVSNPDYIRRTARNLDLSFEVENPFCILVIQIAETALSNIGPLINDLRTAIDSHQFFNSYICENQQGYHEVNLILISNNGQDCSKNHLCNLAKELMENFSQEIAGIGISNTFTDLTRFHEAYVQAVDAIANKTLLNTGEKYIHFGDININEKFAAYFTTADWRNLALYIESGNYPRIEEQLDLAFNNLSQNSQVSTKMLTKLYFEMVLFLENILNKKGLSLEQVFIINLFSQENFPNPSSVESLKELLTSYAIRVSEQSVPQTKAGSKTLLVNIKSYLEKNYFEDITLDNIAQNFFISRVYFSQQFKKEFGMTFTAYLNQVRMEQAAQLFKTKRLMVHEVALMVGFADPLYFGQAFKKHFGVTPSKYLESLT